jgi:acetoin utilization protein AcuB
VNIEKWMNRTYPIFKESELLGSVLEKVREYGLSTIITTTQNGRLSGIVSVDEIDSEDYTKELAEIVREPAFYCTESDFIEDAALMLIESHDYLLPVVDEEFVVTGVISVFEILEGLMEFTAMDKPGARISICMVDKPGALRDVVDFLAEKEINILSIITASGDSEGTKRVVIRTDETDIQYIAGILEENGISFETISEEEGFGA